MKRRPKADEEKKQRLRILEEKTAQLESGEYELDKYFNIVPLKENPKAVPLPDYARKKR